MKAILFGTRLKELRTAGGMKQGRLASEAGISQGQVSRLEHGEVDPDRDIVERLAKALGFNIAALVAGTEFAHFNTSGGIVATVQPPARTRLAYFASALTHLSDEQRREVFRHGEVAQEVCSSFMTFLYRPAQYTDPVNNPDITPVEVYKFDRGQVANSDILVLHCGHASFGAGQELEIAAGAGIGVVLLVPNGRKVSRMVTGSYANIEVVHFETDDQLRTGLTDAMHRLSDAMAVRASTTKNGVGRRVQALRIGLGLSIDAVARRTGVAPHAISQLEAGDESTENPSLLMLRRLAEALRTDVCYLTSNVQSRPEEIDPVVRQSKATFDEYVMARAVTVPRATSVWANYLEEYNDARKCVADARAEPLSVDDWHERFTARAGQQVSLLAEEDE